jgi:hypothetical protein
MNGSFFVYSDEGVEVIVRTAHRPGEELFRADHHPIPEVWLSGKPVDSVPGGTEEEQFAEWIGEMSMLIGTTIEAAQKSA